MFKCFPVTAHLVVVGPEAHRFLLSPGWWLTQ